MRSVVRPLTQPGEGQPRVEFLTRLRGDARLHRRPPAAKPAGRPGPKPKWGPKLPPQRQGGRWTVTNFDSIISGASPAELREKSVRACPERHPARLSFQRAHQGPPFPDHSDPGNLTVVGTTLFFTPDEPLHGRELRKVSPPSLAPAAPGGGGVSPSVAALAPASLADVDLVFALGLVEATKKRLVGP